MPIKLFWVLNKKTKSFHFPLSSVFQRVPAEIRDHFFDAACSLIVVERESCCLCAALIPFCVIT